ncbi:unnamed protein product [Prunus armeniaca]
MAKDKIVEAQDSHLREERPAVAEGGTGSEAVEAEEVATARAEVIESFRGSEELRSYIMDQMVAMQLRWEQRLVKFNPLVEINFDTSGKPPSPSPSTNATPKPEPEPATTNAPSTES